LQIELHLLILFPYAADILKRNRDYSMEDRKKKEILELLVKAVVEYDEESIDELCRSAVENQIDPQEAIQNGLSRGMHKVGELYDRQEYGIPEVLLCADVFSRGAEVLKPFIQEKASSEKLKCTVLIGTVEGDIHSIGKNMVKFMLGVGGFNVVDLGEDVPAQQFIDRIKGENVDIVALSTMMTTTLASMKRIIDEIKIIFPDTKFLVGGASLTNESAEKMRADGYAENATAAVEEAKQIAGAMKTS
jgi:methanogenic corrinoid protein MtbC1